MGYKTALKINFHNALNVGLISCHIYRWNWLCYRGPQYKL